MKLAIMQPYFFPYIGYFQLMHAVDTFVVYDNIKYTKKGWINRNRMLQNGADVYFSLPLKSDSDFLDVRERTLADDFNRNKLLNQLKGNYRRAPCFDQVFPLIERVVQHEDNNLFGYLHHSILEVARYLKLNTKILISSELPIDHSLKNQDKVIALCEAAGASTYVNAIGGMELYSPEDFMRRIIALRFLRSAPFEYPQFGGAFVPWLSIIDVLMFNPEDRLQEQLCSGYTLIGKTGDGMSKTLDLGCAWAPKNPFNADEAYGIDIADVPNPNVKKADLIIEPIPFDDETFNFVTAHDFLEHVPRMIYLPERRNPFIELMNESYRVLKFGGMFLSLTPAFPHAAAFQDPTHVNIITENTFPFYFDNVHRWAAGYGFKGAFQIMMQEWRGSHLLTVMQKVPVPVAEA